MGVLMFILFALPIGIFAWGLVIIGIVSLFYDLKAKHVEAEKIKQEKEEK